MRLRAWDTNQNQFSGANSDKIQGARSDAIPLGIVSDEQRRRLSEFARPKGSQKMDDFFVAPPQRSIKPQFRRRASKSSHFLTSKADFGSNPAPLRRAHLFISGRVQGVLFRDFMKRKAKKIGVNGWIKNLPVGKVEAVLEGEKENVEKLIEWAKKGPFLARVDDFELKWEKYQGEFNKFKILIIS